MKVVRGGVRVRRFVYSPIGLAGRQQQQQVCTTSLHLDYGIRLKIIVELAKHNYSTYVLSVFAVRKQNSTEHHKKPCLQLPDAATPYFHFSHPVPRRRAMTEEKAQVIC